MVLFSSVGVYKKEKELTLMVNSVFIPFTTFQKAFNSGERIGWMAISVKSIIWPPSIQKLKIYSKLNTIYTLMILEQLVLLIYHKFL